MYFAHRPTEEEQHNNIWDKPSSGRVFIFGAFGRDGGITRRAYGLAASDLGFREM